MAADYVVQLLNQLPELHCSGVCLNAFEAREQLLQQSPDLLLLDIDMPGLSGIQLARSLKQLPCTIFITSHDKYAVEAFELDAVDYLMKPVTFERLLRAIDKVKALLSIKDNYSATDHFRNNDPESFFIKDKQFYQRYFYRDLLYMEASGDFSLFYFINGEKKTVLVSIKHLEPQLPAEQFIRISRSHIINRSQISSFDNKENLVSLGKLQFPLGKNFSESVKNEFARQTIKRFI